MAPIGVISGARAFGGNHGRAQRILGSTKRSEGGAVMRLFDTTQNLAADADLRFLGIDLAYIKQPFGVMLAELGTQLKSTCRNVANSSPLPVTHLEDILYQFLGRTVPLASKYPGILVFHDIAPCFEQAHGHQCSLQKIKGLETSNDNWDVVALGDRLVIAVADDRAHMAWAKESLHAILR